MRCCFIRQIMCDDSDLKDIGVPMGPRKKLMSFIRDHQERERKRQEEMEKLAAQMQEAELLEQQQGLSEAATTPIPSGIVPSNPALPDNVSFMMLDTKKMLILISTIGVCPLELKNDFHSTRPQGTDLIDSSTIASNKGPF